MSGYKKVLKEWIIPFALEVVAILLIIKFVVFVATVPTGSMIPTVNENSRLIATRMYFPEKTVQRGDILVFKSDELGLTLLKRAVGLPGDEIILDEDGKMFVNGLPYPEPYVMNTSPTGGMWQVPEGCYLFMGDNRSGSDDARYWNDPYISADKLVGEARFTIFPFKDFGVLK